MMSIITIGSLVFIFSLVSIESAVGQHNSIGNGTQNSTIDVLVKLHGGGMIAAWGILVPIAMSIALMGKSICPGKAYVYTHMAFMLLALVVVVVSLIVILIHAEGKWLNNFDPLSEPHKIMGLTAIVILVINPFIAIVAPKEDSKWRSLYNIAHGGLGFFIGFLSAAIAMLIAVHFLPLMARDIERSRLVISLMSGLVGYIILLLAVYNIYPIRYHKSIPQPYKVKKMVRRHLEHEGALREQDSFHIPQESSPDSTYRVVAMTITLTPLIVLGIVTISYLAILN